MSGLRDAGRSRLRRPLWVCAPSPSTILPLFRPPPIAPAQFSCPVRVSGIGGFPAALAQGAVALRDVLVSGGPGISAEASEGEEASRETQREQFTEKYSLSPFGDISEIKGLWVEVPKSRETSQEACLKMPRSFATPAGGSLALQGDNFVVFNAVGYSVLISVQYRFYYLCFIGMDFGGGENCRVCRDVETFQTFLDPNVVIVKKLFNTLF